MKDDQGMTVIVKTITRISVWLIILYGIYITLQGHITPGGGFAGGVIIALALLNVLLAYGKKFVANWINIEILHDMEATSAVLYLLIGVLGIAFTGSFLANFLSKGQLFRMFSAGTIPILNITIGVKVASSLFIVIWALSLFHLMKGGN